jgi:hypothetical protein
MLEVFAHEHDVGGTKAIILITAESDVAVDVRAAERGLKIEWDEVSRRNH